MDYILFVLAVTILLDAMDANYFHKWLADKGEFFTNRWEVKYKADGSLKWWVYLGGAAWIDFWHVCKSLLLLTIFIYSAEAWWHGVLAWLAFGFLHEHVFYGRWKK